MKRRGLTADGSTTADIKPVPPVAGNRHPTAVWISGCGTVGGILASWTPGLPDGVSFVFFVTAIVAGGWVVVPKAFRALGRRTLDMNVLMTVAVAGAVAIGQWSEGSAVMFLFALSEFLEALSLRRANRAIQALMTLTPETALLKRGQDFEEVPVEEVAAGDVIAVKSGERIPLDGDVLAGASSVNQAPITGEPLPVEKKPGDAVFAGTVNGEGSLEVRVAKPSDDTMLARIIRLVGEAQARKAPVQRFVDVFARYYTPLVMVLALMVWLLPPLFLSAPWPVWTYRALALLVIACPCALVIATPVAIVSGLTALARRGVLVKGGTALETLGRLDVVALDKTGTITEGHPRVLGIFPREGATAEELLRVAAAINVHSSHPLARAVVEQARGQGISFPRGTQYRTLPGRGARAEWDGRPYFVGSLRLAGELGADKRNWQPLLERLGQEARSVVAVGFEPHDGCPAEILGLISLGDTLRPGAPEAVKALHATGVGKLVLLSGDNQKTVDAIAAQAGIDVARGGLLPEQKLGEIRLLKESHRHVAMVGDGINDAPALAAADVGIAMGMAGTDAALEAADVALMKDDLSKVAEAVRLGRRVMRVIRFNITFALAIKAFFLLLAVGGYTSLWLAILADTGATLIVVANALRLLK